MDRTGAYYDEVTLARRPVVLRPLGMELDENGIVCTPVGLPRPSNSRCHLVAECSLFMAQSQMMQAVSKADQLGHVARLVPALCYQTLMYSKSSSDRIQSRFLLREASAY